MVGRARQLKLLNDAFDNVVSSRTCHLFTVLGSAGVGKTRLVYEFLRSLGDVRVVQGHCLSYGEGITYWPVVEVVKQLGGADALTDETAQHALNVVLGRPGRHRCHAGSDRLGVSQAARGECRRRAALCLFDDIQWGEGVFLELIEHVADLSRGAPILLLCMARPELLDRRPNWAGGKLNATTVLLEPLSEDETDDLIASLLEGSTLEADLQSRIRRSAGGNPLFVEEMLALALQSGDGDIAVPPSIQALLAARLDQLDPSERHVLERGSVEGEVFHRGAVAALGRGEARVDESLTALVRKDLLRPEQPQLAGEDGYRFRHLLIRDAAYEALPKSTRAELHELFASWLERHGAELVELDEILGYHLEQAFRYRRELGPFPTTIARRPHVPASSSRARGDERTTVATGRRPRSSSSVPQQLLPDRAPSMSSPLLARGRCLGETGIDWEAAEIVLERALDEADALDGRISRCAPELELSYVTITGGH